MNYSEIDTNEKAQRYIDNISKYLVLMGMNTTTIDLEHGDLKGEITIRLCNDEVKAVAWFNSGSVDEFKLSQDIIDICLMRGDIGRLVVDESIRSLNVSCAMIDRVRIHEVVMSSTECLNKSIRTALKVDKVFLDLTNNGMALADLNCLTTDISANEFFIKIEGDKLYNWLIYNKALESKLLRTEEYKEFIKIVSEKIDLRLDNRDIIFRIIRLNNLHVKIVGHREDRILRTDSKLKQAIINMIGAYIREFIKDRENWATVNVEVI